MAIGKMTGTWRWGLLMILTLLLMAACSSGGSDSSAPDQKDTSTIEDGTSTDMSGNDASSDQEQSSNDSSDQDQQNDNSSDQEQSDDSTTTDSTPITAVIDASFEVIAQGEAPTAVACFSMIFTYYQDQGTYIDAETAAAVSLDQADGTSIAQDSQLWNWINAGSPAANLQQLYKAAYNLNDDTGRAYYFVKLNNETSLVSATESRIQQLAYITRYFLKQNHPVIIEMKPYNQLLNPNFYLVLLGYDSDTQTITYACPRDGGYKATTSYTDFIENYFYKTGTIQEARWDGAWLGFFHGTAPAGDHRYLFEKDGYERSYELHVPAGYTGTSAVPLVLDFHGIYMNAEIERKTSGFKALSETGGFIVVYPEGIDTMGTTIITETGIGARSWNADTVGLQWYSWANLTDVDDVDFSVKVVDEVKRQLNIDQARVYVSGLSQGGSMALLCAHERGDVFAAAAVVSTALLKLLPDYNPQRPIAVANFHSYEDLTVPYYGNILTALPPIEDTARRWAVVNGCDYANPTVTILGYPDAGNPTIPEKITIYGGGDNGVEVRMYSLHTSSDYGDAHVLYRSNLHGDTTTARQHFIAEAAWEFLKRFTL